MKQIWAYKRSEVIEDGKIKPKWEEKPSVGNKDGIENTHWSRKKSRWHNKSKV